MQMAERSRYRGLWITVAATAGALTGALEVLATDVIPDRTKSVFAVPRSEVKGWTDRHEALIAESAKTKWPLLFIGDGFAAGWAKEGKAAWKTHFAPRGAGNIGIDGDQTQHILWRVTYGAVEGQSPEVIVLQAGAENLADGQPTDDVIQGLVGLAMTTRNVMRTSKILMIGMLPRGDKASDPNRKQVRAVNAALSRVADQHRFFYLDVGQELLDKEGNLSKDMVPDGRRLSAAGYAKLAEAMSPMIDDLWKMERPEGF